MQHVTLITSKSIIISVSIAFFIIFFPLVILEHSGYHEITIVDKQHQFYIQEFNPNLKKIYLIGASNVGQLNVTLINENISKKYSDYTAYNLGLATDYPSKRMGELSSLISTHPSIIIYGISYRDFQSEVKGKPLPDPQEYFDKVFASNELGGEPINPKLLTLQVIRNTFNYTTLFPPEKKLYIPNTPFYFYFDLTMGIEDDSQLRKEATTTNIVEINSVSDNKELISFKKIIEELQKNNIKVIIFTPPIHRYYLDNLSNTTRENFDLILKNISSEYNVKIYNFTNKYEDLPIWADNFHISYNKKSMLYSKDISKLILEEISH